MPRTLAQNATYINETIKPAIKSAIEAQGVTVPSTDSFLDYADRIGEIEGGGSGYQLKDLPTGAISTVNDAAELPLNALKVSVEAWQEGSGDPSPSNIRPIHGRDSGDIGVVGKNLSQLGSVTTLSNGNIRKTNGTIYDGITSGVTYSVSLNMIAAQKSNTSQGNRIGVWLNDTGTSLWRPDVSASGYQSFTFTATADGFLNFWCQAAYDSDTKVIDNVQIEIGNQPTTYEPYQGKQYTLDFPQTIYGAEWDVVNGKLKQTDGYIASYNGESLPSSWISDRDVYDGTNTPTIGAEVVYKLATPATIQLSPLSIRLLEGTNNLYADCGEVIEGEYFIGSSGAYDLYDYIQSDGTQYINTGRKLSSGDVIRCLYVPQSGNSNWNYAWASYDNSTVKGGLVFISNNIKAQYINGSEANRESYSNGTFYEDTLTMTADSNGDTYVFSYSADTACCSYMRLYAFSINGDDYLPCKRRSDGKFGLYDVANSQFLTDSASGNAFVGGNNLGVRIG